MGAGKGTKDAKKLLVIFLFLEWVMSTLVLILFFIPYAVFKSSICAQNLILKKSIIWDMFGHILDTFPVLCNMAVTNLK